jgi:hypothetical protein
MAKRRRVNKSAKVREYLAEHPDAGPAETARALQEYGVTSALVSNVRARGAPGKRKKRKGVARRRSVNRNGAPQRHPQTNEPLVAAAELILLCGGVDEARAALEMAGQVASVLG